MRAHHLIFEGVELAGKSYIISQIYNYLEKKYSSEKFPNLLDGCHWFNCDIGLFGSNYGLPILQYYLKMFEVLKERNLILEKFHISDQVYSSLYQNTSIDYTNIEKNLKKLDFRIIFIQIKEDEKIFTDRLMDRLRLYPHYERIAQKPTDYIKQQIEYKKFIDRTSLPVLKIDSTELPNQGITNKILKWIKEK